MNVSSNSANIAAQNIAKSTQTMNQLNQKITDASQDLSGKLIRTIVENKVNMQQNASRLDLLA